MRSLSVTKLTSKFNKCSVQVQSGEQYYPGRSLGGATGPFFLSQGLTSAFVGFADAHMVEYYHFMVTIMSNLIENES